MSVSSVRKRIIVLQSQDKGTQPKSGGEWMVGCDWTRDEDTGYYHNYLKISNKQLGSDLVTVSSIKWGLCREREMKWLIINLPFKDTRCWLGSAAARFAISKISCSVEIDRNGFVVKRGGRDGRRKREWVGGRERENFINKTHLRSEKEKEMEINNWT